MKKYVTKKYAVILIAVVVTLLFIGNSYYKKRSASLPIATQESIQEQSTKGVPIRLQIPIINVDAKIESLGITKDGAMKAPNDRFDVSWYNLGTRPGDIGSAVIAGHTNWKNQESAIFDDLSLLKIGDKILISDNEGSTTSFTVKELRTYDKNANTPEVFFSSDGKHLNLITCSGVWDTISHTSTKRLVVFADISLVP